MNYPRYVALAFLSPVAAAQTTLHVPDDVPTIQGAIALAQPGDTVRVAPGTYLENLDFLGKAIVVESEAGASATRIEGQGLGPVVSFHTDEGPGSVLRGFYVTGGLAEQGGGLSCSAGGVFTSPRIERCTISGNQGGQGGGVSGAPTLEDCVLQGNSADGPGGGAWGAPQMSRCVVSGNQANFSAGGGLYLTGGTVRECTIVGNGVFEFTSSGGVRVDGEGVRLEHCVIAQNVCASSLPSNAAGAGLSVRSGVPLILRCTVAGNRNALSGPGPHYGGIRGPARLVNTIVYGNNADELDPLSGIQAFYCDVEGGYPGPGNFDLNPQFRDALGGDYRLLPGSPCIDAGAPAAAPDPDGSRADVGALTFTHARTSVRNGTGVNPLFLASVTPPAIGTDWIASIDPTGVGGVQLAGIRVQTAALEPGVLVPAGELLVGGATLASPIRPTNGVLDSFVFAIPNDLALLGLQLHAQGIVRSASGFRLGNALRVLIGQ